jgi:hypothetical protein
MGVLFSRIVNGENWVGNPGTSNASNDPADTGKLKKGAKKRYKQADLPFPSDGVSMTLWRKRFVPSLLSWAGSQDDPFGANDIMSEEVGKIWKQLFPDVVFDSHAKKVALGLVCLLLYVSVLRK